MVEDNPIMYELEELIAFCRAHTYVYLYGHEPAQKLISKYLAMAQQPITGFLVPEVKPEDTVNEPFPVVEVMDVPKHQVKSMGVIFSMEDCQYNAAVSKLKRIGVKDIYFMSTWNKRTIPYKMTPRSKEMFWLEVNLADHCNLNCQCCDHFAQLAQPCFLDYDQYVKDIRRLAELTDGHIGIMKLQGGEPLLNDRVIDYMRVTREVFPKTQICLFTDGLLLAKWGKRTPEFWKTIKECEIEVRVTRYPIPFNIEEVQEQAEAAGIEFTTDAPPPGKAARIWYFSEVGALQYKGEKHSVKHPFDLRGEQEPFRFISCYQFNESIVLRDGKIYTCPMIPYVHYFNDYFGKSLEVCEEDYIDIYQVNSFAEIAEFCTHRVPFCRYCAVQCRHSRIWKQSAHTEEEYVLDETYYTKGQTMVGKKERIKEFVKHHAPSFLYEPLRSIWLKIK